MMMHQWDSAGKEKMFTKFSSRKSVCSILMYNGKVTLLADKESEKNALYFLDDSSDLPSWKEVLYSDISGTINPNNCLTEQYKEKLIIITHLHPSARLQLYVYSPTSDNTDKCWKSVSLALLQSDMPSNATFQLQSCAVVSDHIYYSLKYGNQIEIYKTNLTVLNKAVLVSSLQPSINQCFFSVLHGHVITFCKKNDKKASVVEVGPLQDIKALQGKYSYKFSSLITLVAVKHISSRCKQNGNGLP